MSTKILGKIGFDEPLLNRELAILKTIDFNEAYSEYEINSWKTCVLANKSGRCEEGISQEYQGSALVTEIGEQVPYIIDLVNQVFYWPLIKSIRIFFSGLDGMIMPHKDYLEFKKGFTRIHIPLQVDNQCFNSEEDRVYNMGKGEIWFLDGRNPHSAGNFGKVEKYTIVIDFDPCSRFAEIFRDKSCYKPCIEPKKPILRPVLEPCFVNETLNFYQKIISENNFKEILGNLIKIHFFKQANCTDAYDWLLEICRRVNSSFLISKAIQIRRHFLGA